MATIAAPGPISLANGASSAQVELVNAVKATVSPLTNAAKRHWQGSKTLFIAVSFFSLLVIYMNSNSRSSFSFDKIDNGELLRSLVKSFFRAKTVPLSRCPNYCRKTVKQRSLRGGARLAVPSFRQRQVTKSCTAVNLLPVLERNRIGVKIKVCRLTADRLFLGRG
jgi:hypothetical protein